MAIQWKSYSATLQSRERSIAQVILRPGGIEFEDHDVRIKTVIGSGIAMVFWHPLRKIGGMCHYMLPARMTKHMTGLDGFYADEALELAELAMGKYQTVMSDYTVRLYGGSKTFPNDQHRSSYHIGKRNAAVARKIVQARGLNCVFEDLEGDGARSVDFEVTSGQITLFHQSAHFVGRI